MTNVILGVRRKGYLPKLWRQSCRSMLTVTYCHLIFHCTIINDVIHTILLIKRHGRKLIFGLRKSCSISFSESLMSILCTNAEIQWFTYGFNVSLRLVSHFSSHLSNQSMDRCVVIFLISEYMLLIPEHNKVLARLRI